MFGGGGGRRQWMEERRLCEGAFRGGWRGV